MTFRLGALAVVLLFGWSFVSAGDLILGRRSRGFVELNEAFLVGLSAAAFLIFPLTLLMPHGAIPALVVILVVAVLARAFGRGLPTEPAGERKPPDAGPLRDDPVATGLVFCLVLLAALFAILNLRYSYLWDGFQIWASKAMVLFHQKGLVKTLWPEAGQVGRVVNYPNLVPLYEALLAFVRRQFVFNELKPVFLAFFVSLIVATYDLASAFVPRRAALLAALLAGSLPALATKESVGGYADMPLACYFAATAAAGVDAGRRCRTGRSALPFLAGGALLVKNEGILFVGVGLGILAVDEALSARRDLLQRLRGAALPVAVMGCYLIERILYRQWTKAVDMEFAGLDVPSLSRAVSRIGLVATETVRYASDFQQWGLLWPVFVAAAVVLISRGDRSERRMALAVAGTSVLYAAIFLMTNWDVPLHVENAFPRLLGQIAPIAVVVIVSAWRRLRSGLRIG